MGARCVALGVLDELLPHHVLEICQKKKETEIMSEPCQKEQCSNMQSPRPKQQQCCKLDRCSYLRGRGVPIPVICCCCLNLNQTADLAEGGPLRLIGGATNE